MKGLRQVARQDRDYCILCDYDGPMIQENKLKPFRVVKMGWIIAPEEHIATCPKCHCREITSYTHSDATFARYREKYGTCIWT